MAADANSDVLIAMNRPAMLADNFMGLSVFRLVTARRHSIKALPNGGGRPTDAATHLLCRRGSWHIGTVRHVAFAGLLLLASTCGIWRQTNPGMDSRNQDNIAINLRTMAKSRLDGLVEGNRQGMIPGR
jgi:hypothetical protein